MNLRNGVEYIRKVRHTIVPLPVKYGRRFRQVFRFLLDHQHASRDRIDEYQWQRLKALVEYAYDHVPFYGQRFRSIGLQPQDIKDRSDFAQIPVLTREEVDTHFEELKSDEFAKFHPVLSSTSGTTRDRMRFCRSLETEIWRRAVVWRHYFNIGYRFREPRVEVTGPLTFLPDNREMPVDYNENALLVDPTSIDRGHCRQMHDRIRSFEPKMMFCHPGAATTLVENLRDAGLPPVQIPLICCVGEKLYPDYRDAIVGYFQGKLTQYYANRENTVAATELHDGNMYVQSDYCYLEFLNENGRPVKDEQADIVSTSLVNHAFPFIRYQTDDVGIFRGHIADASVGFPVMGIVGGRGRDLLLTRAGLRCTYLPLNFDRHGFDRYQRVQLVQLTLNDLILKVVPSDTYRGDEDDRLLRKICQEELGSEFSVEVQLVDYIPPTDSCKNKKVISQPAVDYLRSRKQK